GYQGIAHLREGWLRAHDIADRGHDPFSGSQTNQGIDLVEFYAERLFDKHVYPASDELDCLRDMQVGRCRDYRGVGGILECVFKPGTSPGLSIACRDQRAQLGVDLSERYPGPSRGEKTSQVTFAD